MDIDLRLPSGEHDKQDEETNVLSNMLGSDDNLHDGDTRTTLEAAVLHANEEVTLACATSDLVDFKEDVNLEPLAGMEFVSHQEAYVFYQEYARSMGFNTAIQNSRRSKTSREFIDAKFACSKYGTKREYDKGNRPRVRQINNQEPESATGRRSCGKTNCKASMHVKRRMDGRWVIHSFIKEHNHDLLPAQAVSEQTRKIYAAMARHYAEYKSVIGLKNDLKSPFDKNRNLVLEPGDAKLLLNFCKQMQIVNSHFFYAVEVSDDLRLKTLLWIDAKSRHDYVNFTDVISVDTTYIRNKYKIPLTLLVGVNQHYQFMLLGCAIVTDESAATYSWIFQTWVQAMGGQAPKVIITDQDNSLKSAVSEVFPNARHCLHLWHVLGKVSDNLGHVIKTHENFMAKFEKCIYRSWTEDEFERRWQKLVARFGLDKDSDWIHLLYEDRSLWVPLYMKDSLLAGLSTVPRSESVHSYFDKYVHRRTSVSEFLKHYESIIQDRYEEEARADSDTWNKQPALKSPSPLEKHMSTIYTQAVFKKFQGEILGAVACHPKRERQDDQTTTFKVRDLEKDQDFMVTWNEMKSEVSCICRLFEYKGFLCRHAMIVLQMCGLSMIPSQYILRRWTKDAKQRHLTGEGSVQVPSRVQRYNDLCNRAMKLSEEGSLSQESYSVTLLALDEAFTNCITANTACKTLSEVGMSVTHGLLSIENGSPSQSLGKTTKKKNITKKRKVNSETEHVTTGPQDTLQPLDKLSSRPVTTLDGFYSTQQSMQGMVQLNLMGPASENYYGTQPAIQGLGQLNSIASGHDAYYSQQGMHGMGQMDFFRAPASFGYGIREDPNVRATQLHDDRHKHS
ncbi:hypothetical protein RND81_08G124300 [Saponaria officinalis]|uniref:Protein FAR1-RELATED SEQUENCE n=1 Tax=Saponaria officinalis TaxID=3572 RepID=A0AAW1J9Z7_SAPOF